MAFTAPATADIQEFDFSVDLLRALLWQYDAAANLQALLAAKKAWYDANQTAFWEGWIRDVFDLRTADEFGLAVWSIILDLPLFVSSPPSPEDKPTWGFGSNNANFGNGNFSSKSGSTNDLPLETKRLALRMRYFQLTSSGCVPEVNRFLSYLFGPGEAYLVDTHQMAQIYVFNFPLTWDLKYLFDNFDIFPRPAGVESSYRDATVNSWGFGANNANFGNGNFGAN